MKRQVVSSRTADFFRRHGQRLHVPLMLTVASLIIGTVTGAVCALFELLPNLLNGARTEWLQSLLNGEADCVTVAVLAFVISFVMIVPAIYLTRKYAPEAGGSGIPEIEGAMVDLRPVRYKRVLPIKFFGGILSLSSGMVLGREGPSIQIGGNLGAAVCDFLKIRKEDFYVLLAAGAASGLASAFNAPLAGMLFVLEEMRPQFKYRFSAVQAVAMAVILSTTVRALIVGNGDPVFDLPVFARVDAKDFIDFLIFGCIVGVAGVLFNRA
uniref:chloride channel protein n=1 Tax=Ruminobacter sp. TaxID=2774296 RepID=UPI003866D619